MENVKKIYKEGVVKGVRYFVITLWVNFLCIPLYMIKNFFEPEQGWNFQEHTLLIIGFCILVVVYLPFAVYLASKRSNQLNTPILKTNISI
ncbi:MAG: hypothetical protein K9L86_05740 [Candidatus Omnitrophica bacterium]|nr:hypothetical protein [Candidatus Omnitrophota bacterium]